MRPVGVFGPHKLKGGGPDPEVGEVGITKVESIGNVWGEFDIEKYEQLAAALGADPGAAPVVEARRRFEAAGARSKLSPPSGRGSRS
ncbi:hypothetical protein B0I32_116183 [Nonomuraea fuscirosea]|uniref:Uncharacterized protein n=1 Tax=Nonomuraea fuscirosea TaxID=1291556 RepID=A0A2T0MRE0_9ACTN|nr:hypothetical protein [Nonomuraea fuscirosea]PRX60792.1 hypothetical protein B0I32_116183 [Nonomuraea fuscirosea]